MKGLRLLAVLEANTVTGPAKNLLQFARTVRTLDPSFEVKVVTFQRPGDPEVFADAAAHAGVELHRIVERGRFDRSVIAGLAELVRRLDPGLVQTHAAKSHLLARCAGVHRIAPWVAFHHGYTWTDLKTRLYNQCDRWSLQAASAVFTVSRPFSAELARMRIRAERIRVIHNSVDPRWGEQAPGHTAALRASLGISPEKRVILIVGRLSREKDHQALLRAMARIRSSPGIPPVHLLVIGEGPERGHIEERARELGLAGHVTLTGQVASAEPYYSLATVAVLSSRTEGSPNALLEAMAARVPIVATAVGGVPEIVSHGDSALLLAPGDVEAMASSIGSLLRDEGLAARLAHRARTLAEERHSPEARARWLLENYRALTGGR
jgi:glycosyltransferase involved in cell wall biosynthesis